MAVRRTAREVLNEVKWRHRRLGDVAVVYRDRVRPEGFRTIRGSEILRLERRYLVLAGEVRLPYYKIDRIEIPGSVLFERPRERSRKP